MRQATMGGAPARRIARALLGLALAACLGAEASAQDARGPNSESSAKADWQAFADCAAGYRANIKSRQSDPSRTPAMRNMIQEQADDYLRAAIRSYMQARHAAQEDAAKAVNARIEGAVDRFVAMDKTGELDRFLEACPQPDDAGDG
ncbi:MAG TPA: hypothetical protein VFV10_00830 [Gammaproteobacteria bacterium]|nr:hypothetical protein [Gammaproteobacteria bacterium]